jgi:hypothetical protein
MSDPRLGVVNIISVLLITTYAGWMLMFLVPLASEVLGTPVVHPSFVRSVLFVFAFNGVLSIFRTGQPKKPVEKKLIY